jgi:hypothetical protein
MAEAPKPGSKLAQQLSMPKRSLFGPAPTATLPRQPYAAPAGVNTPETSSRPSTDLPEPARKGSKARNNGTRDSEPAMTDQQRPQGPEIRPQIRYKRRGRPHLETVCDALAKAHGLVEPAARLLDMDAGNLTKYIQHHPRCQEVKRQARAKMGDFTESKQFELIAEKHWPAIQYYLSTQCKDRGYVLPRGTALNAESTTNVTMIGSVTVTAVESGKFIGPTGVLEEGDGPVIEGEKGPIEGENDG